MTDNPGRALVAHRRLHDKTCNHCGEAFTARVEARYCSPECRYAAAYERRKEKKR